MSAEDQAYQDTGSDDDDGGRAGMIDEDCSGQKGGHAHN